MERQIRNWIELDEGACHESFSLKKYACNTKKLVDPITNVSMCSLGNGKFIFSKNSDFSIVIDEYVEYYHITENYDKYKNINPTYADCFIFLYDQNLEADTKEENIMSVYLESAIIVSAIGLAIGAILNLFRGDAKIEIE
jgi:hypothetical protein